MVILTAMVLALQNAGLITVGGAKEIRRISLLETVEGTALIFYFPHSASIARRWTLSRSRCCSSAGVCLREGGVSPNEVSHLSSCRPCLSDGSE